ncbi:uncharacterized protein LOC143213386 [Lasioglossum baleicum]|uniref:uncharacterized protein LOC143213386 n=1 Tax=Lasioglossum baleicum TaxID=434251 RepID=UPI003FCD4BAA
MDISKSWHKYKQELETSLCFSVMGQRRFRISMGALIASPEAGDSLVNVTPQVKKYSAITDDHSKSFISTMSERDNVLHRSLIRSTNFNSVNGVNKREYEEALLMHNYACDKISNSTLREDCQFPYYRSSKYYSQCSDTVLMKDVGVSCMLLNSYCPDVPVSEAKNYLVKQLKREYNDLSNITNKITAYTRDILNHLSKKHQKNHGLTQNLVTSKHAIASQYVDSKGNLCLKLRLSSNKTQCSKHQIAEKTNNTANDDENVVEELDHEYSKKEIVHDTKHEKEVQTLFIGEKAATSTSSFLSRKTSSIYNYLATRRKRSSNETIKSSYKKNNRKENFKRSNPVVFTNWKEISKSRRLKNNIPPTTCNKSRETIEIKGTSSQAQSLNSRIHNILNTRFHTVNIRIIKHSKKQV